MSIVCRRTIEIIIRYKIKMHTVYLRVVCLGSCGSGSIGLAVFFTRNNNIRQPVFVVCYSGYGGFLTIAGVWIFIWISGNGKWRIVADCHSWSNIGCCFIDLRVHNRYCVETIRFHFLRQWKVLWFSLFGFLIDWSGTFYVVVVCGACIVQCILYLVLVFAIWIRPAFDGFFAILVDCRYGKKRRNRVVLLHVDQYSFLVAKDRKFGKFSRTNSKWTVRVFIPSVDCIMSVRT
jgi:hypothetical protein